MATLEQQGEVVVTRTEQLRIREGAVYEYISDSPPGRKFQRYRVHRLVVAVPSYQQQVLVECLEGPDAGLWFVTSLGNFAMRYRLEGS